MIRRTVLTVSSICALALLAAGCGGGGADVGPPEGWQAQGDYWWTPGADTARAFRNLSSVKSMGVAGDSPVLSASQQVTDEQMTLAAKQEMEKLYRRSPETVDSLFAEYIAPKVTDIPRGGDLQENVASFGRESHRTITSNYFKPASKKLTLGQDIPITYPDSLFDQGVSGNVWMQVYVDAEGQPQAVKLLESVHPTLDDSARRAITQMRWEPARVREGQHSWRDIPSWTWVSLGFGQTS